MCFVSSIPQSLLYTEIISGVLYQPHQYACTWTHLSIDKAELWETIPVLDDDVEVKLGPRTGVDTKVRRRMLVTDSGMAMSLSAEVGILQGRCMYYDLSRTSFVGIPTCNSHET